MSMREKVREALRSSDGPASRADIESRSGLDTKTVSTVLSQLTGEGKVAKTFIREIPHYALLDPPTKAERAARKKQRKRASSKPSVPAVRSAGAGKLEKLSFKPSLGVDGEGNPTLMLTRGGALAELTAEETSKVAMVLGLIYPFQEPGK